MAVTGIEDLVSPDVGAYQDVNGVTAVRKFNISGLTPGPGMWYQARQYLQATYGIYYRANHPVEPNCIVNKIDPKPFLNSQDQSTVYVTYQSPQWNGDSSMVIRFQANVRQIDTNFNRDGTSIHVEYTPGTGGGSTPCSSVASGSPGTKICRVGQVQSPQAYGILEFSQTTYAPPSIAFLRAFNKINSQAWQGGDQYTWWFRDLDVQESVYDGTYRTVFRFEYNDKTYAEIAAYRDINGYVPIDVDDVDYTKDSGNGWTKAVEYLPYDFNTLGLRNVLSA